VADPDPGGLEIESRQPTAGMVSARPVDDEEAAPDETVSIPPSPVQPMTATSVDDSTQYPGQDHLEKAQNKTPRTIGGSNGSQATSRDERAGRLQSSRSRHDKGNNSLDHPGVNNRQRRLARYRNQQDRLGPIIGTHGPSKEASFFLYSLPPLLVGKCGGWI